MRKQKSPCTISSNDNISDWQASSFGKYANQNLMLNSNFFCSQSESLDSDQNSSPSYSLSEIDQNVFSNPLPQSCYFQNFEQTFDNGNFNSLNPSEPFVPLQCYEDSFPDDYTRDFTERTFTTNCTMDYTEHSFPTDDSFQGVSEPSYSPFLLLGMPTVTNYGAVTILLRHLIRVDITCNGSVSVYNFPGQSVTVLNAAGNKCYVKHPNGTVLQDGSMVHMAIGNNRFAKITQKGLMFSHSKQGLGYFIDESGTKTSTARFIDFAKNIVMDIFFDGNRRSLDQLEQECYRMALQATYQKFPDGSELWVIGRIRIKQDNWGEVTVSQNNGRRLIMTSPTIRRATVDSASININIDCYSKNYFTVRKDSCSVTSGFCGLIVRNKSQKAGLDRSGKLVLF